VIHGVSEGRAFRQGLGPACEPREDLGQLPLWGLADDLVDFIEVDRVKPIDDGGAATGEAGGDSAAVRVPGQLDVVRRRRVGEGRRDGHHGQRLVGGDVGVGVEDDRWASLAVAVTVANDGPDDAAGAKLVRFNGHGGPAARAWWGRPARRTSSAAGGS
jgi:hypothetical protein